METRDFNEYKLKLASTGSMMVIDVNSGRVLAMAQYPTYDLNAMVAGGEEVAEILMDERRPCGTSPFSSARSPVPFSRW